MGTRRALLRSAEWPRPVRWMFAGLGVIVIVLAVGVTGYRTLRPAETVTLATNPIASPSPVSAVKYGELTDAPLIVDGTLRIYAEQRRVFADTPVTSVRIMTPHWSYRRWPAQVVGLTTVEKSSVGGSFSVVLSKWSDGVLVALDAETGESLWQTRIDPVPGETFDGRLDGASVVWDPTTVLTSTASTDQRPVVIITGKDQAEAVDPWTGENRWTKTFADQSGCHNTQWTGQTTYFVKDTCETPAVLDVYDAATGMALTQWRPPNAATMPADAANWFVQPASCQLGNSQCAMFEAAPVTGAVSFSGVEEGVDTTAPAYYTASSGGVVKAVPAADQDDVFLVGDTVVQQVASDYVWAYSAKTGTQLWRSEVSGKLVFADAQNVYLINDQYQLVVLNLISGAVTSSTELRTNKGEIWNWDHTYVHDGYLALERLRYNSNATMVDDLYYYGGWPVLIVGVGS